MKYKLVAIDMDGTLLNSDNKISNRNMEILHKAVDKGIYIVLSTGRILESALYYAKSIGLKNPIVACNGAIVSCEDGKDIIYEKYMNIETSKKVMEIAEESNIYYHFYDRNTFYTKDIGEELYKFYKSYEDYEDKFKKQQINLRLLDDPMEFLKDEKPNIYKFVFIEDDEDKLLNFRRKLGEIENINISSSWYNNVEVMNEGVSKGNALKHLSKVLNIDKSEIVAIGDNENDISMFKIAGLAVAMKNGDEIIKKHSHVITDTNDENGVGNAIAKYVLNI